MGKIYKPKITSIDLGGTIFYTKQLKQMHEQLKKDNIERKKRLHEGKPNLTDYKND